MDIKGDWWFSDYDPLWGIKATLAKDYKISALIKNDTYRGYPSLKAYKERNNGNNKPRRDESNRSDTASSVL
jgi:hypothetical protein